MEAFYVRRVYLLISINHWIEKEFLNVVLKSGAWFPINGSSIHVIS